MTRKHQQPLHTILTFICDEFNFDLEKSCDIALALVDYSDSLIDMIKENKQMAKTTIMHDFNGLNQNDCDFSPRLTQNK